jgi:hypothetical protein
MLINFSWVSFRLYISTKFSSYTILWYIHSNDLGDLILSERDFISSKTSFEVSQQAIYGNMVFFYMPLLPYSL